VTYAAFLADFPGEVRITQEPAAGAALSARTDVTFRVSQIEVNTPIDAAAFRIEIPGDALPMSLAELRQIGPLAEQPREVRKP